MGSMIFLLPEEFCLCDHLKHTETKNAEKNYAKVKKVISYFNVHR